MPKPAQTIGYTKTDRAGAICVLAGSALWGLFWIPLRYLDDAGVTGLWAIATVLVCALIPAVLLSMIKNETTELISPDAWLLGTALGLATVLYFIGILYSDVVRVIFLFYLLPVWTTLSARLIYGEPIRGTKLLVIGTALVGLWLLLGGGTALPYPKNPGDWAAIGAGFCWGICLSLLRGRKDAPPYASTAITLFAGFVLSVLTAIATMILRPDIQAALPPWPTLRSVFVISAAFGMIAIFPAMLGQIWGARRIPAPTAALLTMSEIIVATLSASVLIGTELGPVALLGGVVIVASVCIDIYAQRAQLIVSPR